MGGVLRGELILPKAAAQGSCPFRPATFEGSGKCIPNFGLLPTGVTEPEAVVPKFNPIPLWPLGPGENGRAEVGPPEGENGPLEMFNVREAPIFGLLAGDALGLLPPKPAAPRTELAPCPPPIEDEALMVLVNLGLPAPMTPAPGEAVGVCDRPRGVRVRKTGTREGLKGRKGWAWDGSGDPFGLIGVTLNGT